MNNKVWHLYEMLPILIYLLGCIAWSAYFLYSFMGLYVHQAQLAIAIASSESLASVYGPF